MVPYSGKRHESLSTTGTSIIKRWRVPSCETGIKNVVQNGWEGTPAGSIIKNAFPFFGKRWDLHDPSIIIHHHLTQYPILTSFASHFCITKLRVREKQSQSNKQSNIEQLLPPRQRNFLSLFGIFNDDRNYSTPSRERVAQLCPSPTLLSSKHPPIFWLTKLFQSLQVKDTQVNCKYRVAVSRAITQVPDFPFSHFDLRSRHT